MPRLNWFRLLNECIAALRDHRIDIVGSSAHAPLLEFPEWDGARLLCAQSQGLYWLLVMRKDLGIVRGDLAALAGRRIAAVPFVGTALARVLIASGIDPKVAEIEITMPDAARKQGVNFVFFARQRSKVERSTASSQMAWERKLRSRGARGHCP